MSGGSSPANQAGTFSISGRVVDEAGAPIPGVTITLTGSSTIFSMTDAEGRYAVSGLAPGSSYTVQPSKAGLTFTPPSRTFTNLSADQTGADFVGAAAQFFSIGGKVVDQSGAPIPNVPIQLTGDRTASTGTDGGGNYLFTELPRGGNYTVQPSKEGFAFTPPSRTFMNLSANQTGADFVSAAGQFFKIGGKVVDQSGAPIPDVTITLTGTTTIFTTTDAGGNYLVTGLPRGSSYTVQPSKADLAFTPRTRVFTNLNADQTAADFVGAVAQFFSIGGKIVDQNGAPIPNVPVQLTGDAFSLTGTDGDGNYLFTELPRGGNYTVQPSKEGFAFTPPSRTFMNLSANQTGADFVSAAGQFFKISGRVVDQSGAPVPGVMITLTGTTTIFTMTDAQGNYSAVGLTRGSSYTVQPSKEGYAFIPQSRSFTNLNADQTGADFLGTTSPVQFDNVSYTVTEGEHKVQITVTRSGDVSLACSVFFETASQTASERKDFTATAGRLRFAAGESSKSFEVLITDDRFDDDNEFFQVMLSDPVGAILGPQSTSPVIITDNDAANGPSPVKDASLNVEFFVRQHYADFLGRVPDQAGLDFWTGRATNCGNPDLLVCRINVSAAFFLSIENQETGYLTHRAYKVAFGNLSGRPVPLLLREYLVGSRRIGEGVQVGVGNWEQQLEANKAAFFDEFVTTFRFNSLYGGLMNEQYVDALNANAGGALSQAERDSLVAELNAMAKTRAQALRVVAEDADFAAAERNRAFVLAQYFGYLRRNPDDTDFRGVPDPNFEGYNFWLSKLNEFNGNFVRAEMVRAFIQSIEYGERFGQ